jgi:hypothetical protein
VRLSERVARPDEHLGETGRAWRGAELLHRRELGRVGDPKRLVAGRWWRSATPTPAGCEIRSGGERRDVPGRNPQWRRADAGECLRAHAPTLEQRA